MVLYEVFIAISLENINDYVTVIKLNDAIFVLFVYFPKYRSEVSLCRK